MFGQNEILKSELHEGLNLDVVEIFPTLQGEGPYVGYPSVFVRLGGCNLACDFCDTEFDNFKNLTIGEILAKVQKFAKNNAGKIVRKLVVITGGEPMRQPISKLCEELINLGFLVQIETNGTLFRELPAEVKIICSPKVSNYKYYSIRLDLLKRINAFKFIISATSESYKNISEVGQSQFDIPVYVQAMDEYDEEKNKKNLELTKKLCQENGYILSLQTHKILGLK